MMTPIYRAALTAAFVLTTASLPAQSAATTPPPPAPGGFDSLMQNVKHPVSWLTWGGDLRVRNEYLDNVLTLTDENPLHTQDLFRFRARVWASATVVTNLSLNTRVSAEPRLWMEEAGFGPDVGETGMEWRYGVVDSLNVKWSGILDQPLSLVVGRQDILLGDQNDWWLVADGTPGDGSWTFFLDGARLTFDAVEVKTRFDLMYITQSSEPDGQFPTIDNSDNYFLTEQDEQGVIVYASNKSIQNTTLDGYFIYKADDKVRANGSDGDIYTFGGKVSGTPIDHWLYSVEGAYQFGNKKDWTFDRREINSYGGKARLTYQFKDKLSNQLCLQGEYLSGDDPATEEDEMFDVLWGRWPRFSELYIYSYPMETAGRIAQLNNIWRIGPTWSFVPLKGMTLSATYNALFAPVDSPTRAINPALFSNDGNFRGHYLQALVKHQFNKYLCGHVWGEFLWEGDYYAQRDLMTFLRAEIMFSF